jgi:hypothetical protein
LVIHYYPAPAVLPLGTGFPAVPASGGLRALRIVTEEPPGLVPNNNDSGGFRDRTSTGRGGPGGPGDPNGPDDSRNDKPEDPHIRLRRTNDALREVLDRLDGYRGWPVAEGEERVALEQRMLELSAEVAELLDETTPDLSDDSNDGPAR